MQFTHRSLLAVASMLAASLPALATTVSFGDFSDTSSLTLNGSAATVATADGNVLRLTPATFSQSGSAFSTTTIAASTFSTYFRFRITDPGGQPFDCNTSGGADGLVFVVQNQSASIGGAGQGIGYAGIGTSVGVEWDTWCNGGNNDPSSNHLGIDVNGDVDHGAGSPNTLAIATDFDDGNIWHAWVDYDGSTLEVRTNQSGLRPVASMLSRTLDLPNILGNTTAYVGFTSGTGADYGNHDILGWEYRDSFNPIGTGVPEPATMWLTLLPLAALLRRRRAR
jgi:hypothetical protein